MAYKSLNSLSFPGIWDERVEAFFQDAVTFINVNSFIMKGQQLVNYPIIPKWVVFKAMLWWRWIVTTKQYPTVARILLSSVLMVPLSHNIILSCFYTELLQTP
jgi:hypothetical protein